MGANRSEAVILQVSESKRRLGKKSLRPPTQSSPLAPNFHTLPFGPRRPLLCGLDRRKTSLQLVTAPAWPCLPADPAGSEALHPRKPTILLLDPLSRQSPLHGHTVCERLASPLAPPILGNLSFPYELHSALIPPPVRLARDACFMRCSGPPGPILALL